MGMGVESVFMIYFKFKRILNFRFFNEMYLL